MSRRFHCRFALATSAFLPEERYGLPRKPTMLSREKASAENERLAVACQGPATPQGCNGQSR